MDWKDFIKFSWNKFGVTFLFFVGFCITMVIVTFSLMDVTLNSNVKDIFIGIHYLFNPFFFMQWYGLILDIIYWYVLSCLILYTLKNKK